MDENPKCPVCGLRERVAAGAHWLLERQPFTRRPLRCQVSATVPLPNQRRLHGCLRGVFFVGGRLYGVKSFARTRRARAGARPFEFRFELSAEPRKEEPAAPDAPN